MRFQHCSCCRVTGGRWWQVPLARRVTVRRRHSLRLRTMQTKCSCGQGTHKGRHKGMSRLRRMVCPLFRAPLIDSRFGSRSDHECRENRVKPRRGHLVIWDSFSSTPPTSAFVQGKKKPNLQGFPTHTNFSEPHACSLRAEPNPD